MIDSLETAVMALAGNKLSGFGNLLILAGLINLDNIYLASSISLPGAALVGISAGGYSTIKHYRRTCKHIEKFGTLDKRFLKKLINRANVEENPLFRYCSLQGVYLAARNYNQANIFTEMRIEHTRSLIPYF